MKNLNGDYNEKYLDKYGVKFSKSPQAGVPGVLVENKSAIVIKNNHL